MNRDEMVPTVTELPGDRAKQWREHHSAVAAPSTHVYDFVWAVTEPAIGPFCTDVDGNVLLDFTSHVASAPLGYNNPVLREKLEALGPIDPVRFAGQDFYASGGWPPDDPEFPGATQLMDLLVEKSGKYGLDTVFLSNSGAEAVENGIKACYDFRPGAKYGITFDRAFHGRTLGALSLNRSKAVHRKRFPEIPGIASYSYCNDRECTVSSCSCGFFPPGSDHSRLRESVMSSSGNMDPDEVAFIIIEPIQGEGGYRIPSQAFMKEIEAVSQEYGIPIIADEIQTGIGRTGSFWASDHFDIEPDVISAAKALRVGATISRGEVFPDEKARLSSTWGGGDVLGSLLGVLSIEVIDDEGLMENAVRRGEQLKELIRDAAVECIRDVRGVGLLVGIEFDSKSRRDAVLECCFKRYGLLTLPAGIRTLRLLPPLDVTAREIEIGVECLINSLSDPEVENCCPTVPTGDDVY